jgi:predicted dienelactone hydrolase
MAAAVALMLVGAACSEDASRAGDTPVDAADEESVDVPGPVTERRPFAVGAYTETLVDDSRGTPAAPDQDIAEKPDRTLDLTVLYPTDGEGLPDSDAGVIDGIDPPEDTGDPVADGRFPLLVFAHGWKGSGASLVGPAQRWAQAGYIVALPTFPLSRWGIGTDVDLAGQPGDVSFVIDSLLADGSGVAGHVDPERIAVGGHSLGSATVFGFQNSCCKDPRVKAIVAISGGPSPYATGEYDPTYETPLLLMHGAKDPGVNPGISEYVFSLPGKMSYLLFAEGTHTSQFEGEDGALLDEALVAFLDAELGLDPEAFSGLEAEVAASGRGTLRSKTE